MGGNKPGWLIFLSLNSIYSSCMIIVTGRVVSMVLVNYVCKAKCEHSMGRI